MNYECFSIVRDVFLLKRVISSHNSYAGLLRELKSYGISGHIFGLIFSFLSNRRLQVVLNGKSSQEYPVNAGVPQGSILGPTLFLLYISDFPDNVICNIAIYANDSTLYSKCDQVLDLWQQLELTSELESNLRDTVDWGRKRLVHFNVEKTQLFLFLNWDSLHARLNSHYEAWSYKKMKRKKVKAYRKYV